MALPTLNWQFGNRVWCYHTRMHSNPSFFAAFKRLNRATVRWLASWWQIFHFGISILAHMVSPASYDRTNRRAVAHHIVAGTTPNLLWFTVLTALISLVLIRIVVVTAISYGLSKYALEMVIRVLVLELIPLTAASFVALRCTLPDGIELAEMRLHGGLDAMRHQGLDPVRVEFLPRILAGVFTVLLLASVSCVSSLVLAYLTIYGFTPWALAGYTRVVGQVFNPGVTMIFALKTIFFSLAVSLIPMASALDDAVNARSQNRSKAANELASMVRLFSVIFLIEVASLVGNYY